MIYDTANRVDTVVAGYDSQLHNAHFNLMVNNEKDILDIDFKIDDNQSQNFPVAELTYDLNKFDGTADELVSSMMKSVREGYDLFDDRTIAFMFQDEQALINDIKTALEPHIAMEIEIENTRKEDKSIVGEFSVNGRTGTFEMTDYGFYVEADNEKDIALFERSASKIEDCVKEEMSKEKTHNKDFER